MKFENPFKNFNDFNLPANLGSCFTKNWIINPSLQGNILSISCYKGKLKLDPPFDIISNPFSFFCTIQLGLWFEYIEGSWERSLSNMGLENDISLVKSFISAK